MSSKLSINLPEDLVAEAAQIEGLEYRVGLFIRAELTQHRKRQSQYSDQARDIVQQALRDAERMKADGVTREESMRRFEETYESIMQHIAARTA